MIFIGGRDDESDEECGCGKLSELSWRACADCRKNRVTESDNIVCGKNLLILVSSSTSCATVDPAVQGVHRCQASHTARKLVANYSDIP